MMKKVLITILSIMLCGSFLVGCAPAEPTLPSEPTYYDAQYASAGEQLSVVDDGATEYKIVIPAQATEIVAYAAEELKFFLDDATGTDIQIVSDSQVAYSENAKLLSVGETSVMESANVTVDFDVTKRDGFVIKTVGKSYVMCGGGDYGTLYAVYEFLHQAIGWETYAIDEIYYQRDEDLKVEKLDILDVPAIESRTGGYFEGRENAYFCAKLRTYANYGIGIFGKNLWAYDVHWTHNYREILNSCGMTIDPAWYGTCGASDPMAQLCLTNDGLRNAMAKSIVRSINNNPEIEYYSIAQEDSGSVCECSNCIKYDAYFGEDEEGNKFAVGRPMLTIEFLKDVLGRVKNEIGAEKYKKYTFVTLAYGYNIEAPITWDESKGEYVPFRESCVVPEDTNISFMFCPYERDFDYNYLAVDPEGNARWKRVVEGYRILCPRMICYAYGNNFGLTHEWYDDFSSYAINVKYFAEHGNAWFFSENSSGGKQSVQFQALRSYVYSKLQWNPYLDINELVDDFMENYYKTGAEAFKKYWEYLRLQYNSVFHDKSVDGTGDKVHSAFFTWSSIYNSYESVVQRLSYIDEAIRATENSTLDDFTKEQVLRRIKIERFSDLSNLLFYHKNKLQANTYNELLAEAKQNAEDYEVNSSRIKEMNFIQ